MFLERLDDRINPTPFVVIDPARHQGQTDPTNNPAHMKFFTSFTEIMYGFTASDVILSGSAIGPNTTVDVTRVHPTNWPTDFFVHVYNARNRGEVTITVPANCCMNASGVGNLSSEPELFDTTIEVRPKFDPKIALSRPIDLLPFVSWEDGDDDVKADLPV